MRRRRFSVRKGYRIPNSEAPEIGRELTRIENDHGGRLTPGHVVDAASDTDSPLHPYFTWDDAEAAHQHRLQQARYLVRGIQVEIVDQSSDEPIEVRAFCSVDDDDGPMYVNVRRAFTDAELRAQVLQEALAQAESWYARYKTYEELAEIASAIRKAKRALRKQGAAAG